MHKLSFVGVLVALFALPAGIIEAQSPTPEPPPSDAVVQGGSLSIGSGMNVGHITGYGGFVAAEVSLGRWLIGGQFRGYSFGAQNPACEPTPSCDAEFDPDCDDGCLLGAIEYGPGLALSIDYDLGHGLLVGGVVRADFDLGEISASGPLMTVAPQVTFRRRNWQATPVIRLSPGIRWRGSDKRENDWRYTTAVDLHLDLGVEWKVGTFASGSELSMGVMINVSGEIPFYCSGSKVCEPEDARLGEAGMNLTLTYLF